MPKRTGIFFSAQLDLKVATDRAVFRPVGAHKPSAMWGPLNIHFYKKIFIRKCCHAKVEKIKKKNKTYHRSAEARTKLAEDSKMVLRGSAKIRFL